MVGEDCEILEGQNAFRKVMSLNYINAILRISTAIFMLFVKLVLIGLQVKCL